MGNPAAPRLVLDIGPELTGAVEKVPKGRVGETMFGKVVGVATLLPKLELGLGPLPTLLLPEETTVPL